ncbi:MAG: PSD1 and planctomycete cytochrome C domain-containing protein [Phycisphaerales bacterium]|nr:PSD1 and planctomycete cytochrome C domain-containing protein [Phycisphaerales bacterium]
MPALALSLLLHTPAMQVDYSRDIQPLLAARCLACHGRDEASREAGLRLDTRSGALAPRRGGAAIVPGDPEASLLIQRVQAADLSDRMPPEGHTALTNEEVKALRGWIAEGAVYEQHWAWKPLVDAPIPDAGGNWAADPIDAFVAQRLDDAGLQPSPPAEATLWLRRLAFDLTGLPPSTELIRRIQSDDSPATRQAIIENMLDSPAFGEHFARHWLDAFSYAETCGHEFDYPLHGAWRFRDWLVRAINSDVPWGRIVSELIAGDLISPRVDEVTGLDAAPLGTGFWCMHQAVHAPVDILRDEDDHRSDQLDALGRGLLGVTISCARCHDHKFDPISARDYQALANMLRSSRRVLAGRDQNAATAQQIQELRSQRAQLDGEITRLRGWIAAAGAMGAGRPRVGDAPRPLLPPTDDVWADFESDTDWAFHGHAFALAPAGTWYPTTDGPGLAQRGMLHSGLLGGGPRGTVCSPEFTIDTDRIHWRVRGNGTLRVIVDDYIMDEFNALLFEGHRQSVDSEDWTTISHDVAKYRGHRAYLQARDVGDGMLEIDAVSFAQDAPWEVPAEDLDVQGLARLDWRLSRADDEVVREGCETLAASAGALQPPVAALRMTDASIVEQPIWDRGEPSTPGDPAPRAVPALLGSGGAIEKGSGRMQLAEAVTSRASPLLWRTAANRIWHHLTGRGLTPSLDDMGAMGMPPTHPLLLDHLALILADGGTVKDVVRRIVSSSTWAQSSARRTEAQGQDPDNALLHRMRVRRLTGEQIRDSMLAASGRLDATVGGPPVPIHLTESMTGRGRPGESGPVDGDGRRSLYLGVRRNFAIPMMEVFDRPTPNRPCGRRSVSNVPAQSLTLMNDPFVRQQAQTLARDVLDKHGANEAALQDLALRAWSRNLTDQECDRLHPGEVEGDWTDLAHAMLCAKEFVFLQ